MYAHGVLEELTGAIDELVSADPSVLGHPEGIIALHRQLARLEAVTTRAVACLEAQQGYVPEGWPRTAGSAETSSSMALVNSSSTPTSYTCSPL